MSETRKITLTMPHKQGDVQHYAGETIEVDSETAEWLALTIVEIRLQLLKQAEETPGTLEFMRKKNGK